MRYVGYIKNTGVAIGEFIRKDKEKGEITIKEQDGTIITIKENESFLDIIQDGEMNNNDYMITKFLAEKQYGNPKITEMIESKIQNMIKQVNGCIDALCYYDCVNTWEMGDVPFEIDFTLKVNDQFNIQSIKDIQGSLKDFKLINTLCCKGKIFSSDVSILFRDYETERNLKNSYHLRDAYITINLHDVIRDDWWCTIGAAIITTGDMSNYHSLKSELETLLYDISKTKYNAALDDHNIIIRQASFCEDIKTIIKDSHVGILRSYCWDSNSQEYDCEEVLDFIFE